MTDGLGGYLMTEKEWIIWIALTLFALLVLRRLGTISRELRSALLPSREFNQPGYLLHDVGEIKERLDSLQKTLESMDNSMLLIKEHLREISLTVEQVHKTMASNVNGLQYAMNRVATSLDAVEERLNPDNRVYSWKPGW